jgi:hypothetical protein
MGFYFRGAIDRRIAAFQNDLMEKHLWKSRIFTSKCALAARLSQPHSDHEGLSCLDENEKIDTYLNSLDTDLTSVDTLIKSGNVMVDAIINSKLSIAEK